MSFSVASALGWWAHEKAHDLAVEVDGEAVTFRELYDWAGRIAADLRDKGLKSGDRVAVCALNSLDYAALIVGLVRGGFVGVPLTFRSTPSELQEGVAATSPLCIFADAERRAIVDAAPLPSSCVTVRMLTDVAALRRGEPVAFEREPELYEPLFVINTSGSTGKPKAAIYTNFGVMSYAAEFAIMEPRCARDSAIYSPGPFSSASGYLLLLQYLSIGASVYIQSKFEPASALQLLTDKKITTMLGVPLFFERMAALPQFGEADLSSLHFAQVAGSRVNMPLLDAWRSKGVVLRHAYGSTEAGGGWAARNDVALSEPEKAGKGGMFNRYAVLGPDGSLAGSGVPGEILARGSAMMGGYWNNPDATAAAFVGGWFRTGDLGCIDDAGNITIIDRLKDIIISGGLNVSAQEVERVIADLPGVEEVAVIAVPDEKFGETPLAVVYGDQARLCTEEIIAHCDRRLSNYKVPRYLVVRDDPLPRLPSGKISKPAIRDLYANSWKELRKVR